jgi:hypothetical protein
MEFKNKSQPVTVYRVVEPQLFPTL